ncbi:MAG: PEP-CTERM sorting domain-containing protein [Sphingomonadales bacterium]|nr:PEP-CTERM sorting domain-containing protein [Sphingomonadales bacterium]
MSASAQATVVFSNNFDAENGGASALNYNSFNGLNSTGARYVDLVASGDYGITCAGGSGSCVDLDGTPGPGTLSSASSYAFSAGDLITLSFAISGNQRGYGADDWTAALNFASTTDITEWGVSVNGTTFAGGSGLADAISFSQAAWTTDFPFVDFTLFARTGNAGSVSFSFATNSADNVGPLLDNVSLDISSAVPEPATWAMMIGGFALVGAAMRRRVATVSFA